MSIANLNDWTKNINPPLFQNTYADGRNTLRYRGGSGYERIYYAVEVPKSNSITFSLKFCTPTGYSCSYGDSQEYIVIFGSPPTSDGPMTNFTMLGRTPVSGTASEVPVEYSVSYINDTGANRTVYLGLDWGYLVDGVEVQLIYEDLQIRTTFNGWMMVDDRLTLANGNLAEEIPGDNIEPPYPSTFWELQDNEVLTLNDVYYTYIISPIVDAETGRNDNIMLTTPYPASFWYLTPEDILKNGLLPVPINGPYLVKPYPASFWWYEEADDRLEDALIPSSIPIGAFVNCRNLTYIKIPSTVTKIGREAFYNSGLTLVRIPAGCIYYPTSFPPGCEIQTYSV